jgi:uncharacterized membrane protein YuzA (DUF378 family)
MSEDLPASRLGAGNTLGVHTQDYTLIAETFGPFADESRVFYGGCVDRDFIGAGLKHQAHILNSAQSSANGQWDENFVGGTPNHLQHDRAVVTRSGNIIKYQLIGALFIIKGSQFHRIAGVAVGAELDAFDHPSGLNVETGDNAFG